jgi:hypothetical protein
VPEIAASYKSKGPKRCRPRMTFKHFAPQPEPNAFRLLDIRGLDDTALSLPFSFTRKYFSRKPRSHVLSGAPQFRHVNSSLFIVSKA